MGKRNVYLENKPWEEALAGFWEHLGGAGLKPGPAERLPVPGALGRVTAKPVYAFTSCPHYAAAAMDGVAVKASLTYGASETSPVRLKLGQEALEVDTGDPLPPGADAVIMAEDLADAGEGLVEVIAAAYPGQHVRQVGEDVVATEMLLPANYPLSPYDLGACLAGGVMELEVHPRPRVAIIPTGDELVRPGERLAPGDIVEFNSLVLGSLAAQWGAEPDCLPITPDNYPALKKRVAEAAAGHDLVLIIAGSSAGRDDYTAAVLGELGEVFTHGVAIKPGKPVILGQINGKPALGIPGYPVSAALALELFARPVIYALQGLAPPERPAVGARLARKLASPLGAEEFVRVKLGRVGEALVATPIARGAGLITSLVRADGLLRVPRLSEGHKAGETVRVELLRPLAEVERTLVIAGSHDLSIDVLASHLRRRYPGQALASANVGSLGGLAALRRGEAHCAGVHLLDPATGEYNITYLPEYLGMEAALVNVSYRQQGLMVAPGNPLLLKGIIDLARPGLRFVNRQAGAGTRVLLDYLLEREGLDPQRIDGYGREEYTHLAVAAAVASGSADAGMGILGAARALGLDFVPVGSERYDLCIPLANWRLEGMQRLLAVLRSPEFQQEVEALGGYDMRDCGRVVWPEGGIAHG